ncbi:MAG: hypothetical protein ACLFUJ_05430 [Phycisphaerae bacterium]
MLVALPVREDRISPVLDEAGECLLAELSGVGISRKRQATLAPAGPGRRARQLADLQVEMVVCGALSRELEAALLAAGLAVHPHVCGPVDAVLEALATNRLDQPAFAMPGCCGQRVRNSGLGRRCRRRHGPSQSRNP